MRRRGIDRRRELLAVPTLRASTSRGRANALEEAHKVELAEPVQAMKDRTPPRTCRPWPMWCGKVSEWIAKAGVFGSG